MSARGGQGARLARGGPSGAAEPAREGELLEREAAVGAVCGALAAARQGRSATVCVLGEAGLGKTAVLELALAAARGFQVVHAQGEATEVTLPFGFLAHPLDRAGFSELLTRIPGMPPEERAAAAWYRLHRWVGEDRSRPLLLLLDDLHWADADSLSLVRLLVRHLPPARGVAVLAGLRPWPAAAGGAAAELAAGGHARVVRLLPLSPSASAALVGGLREGAASGAAVPADDIERCEGNPFLLRHLAGRVVAGRPADPDARPGGATQGLLLARFTGFDAAALRYARAAAVLGVRFRVAVAGGLTDLAPSAAGAALEALHAAGLLRTVDPATAAFTHALLRQALYEDLAPPVRGGMHAAAFRLLWEQGVPAGEAAAHAVAAHLLGDPDAVAATERAGMDALAQGALEAAVPWIKASQELAGERAGPALRLRLAEGLHAAGAPSEAAAACRALLSQPDLDLDQLAEANRLLGRALFQLGEAESAVDCLRRSAGLVAQGRPSMSIEALLEASLVTLYTHGPRRSLGLAEEAKSLIGRETDPSLAAWVGSVHGQARLLLGDGGGAEEVSRALERLQGSGGIRGLHGSAAYGPRLAQLQVAKVTERFDEAIAAYQAAGREAAGTMIPLATSLYGVAHADTLSRLGRLQEAKRLLQTAREEGYGVVARSPWATVGLAHVHFELDEPEEAAACCLVVEAALRADGDGLPALRIWRGRVRAGLALQQGDADAASALMTRVEAIAGSAGVVEPCAVPWYAVAIHAHLAAGRPADAGRVLDKLDTASAGTSRRWPRAVSARGRALLADLAGDRDTAEGLFAQALEWHRGLPMPLEEVETLIAYGAFLRRSGAPVRARKALGRAEGIADGCGALRLQRLAVQELHAAAGRRRRRAAGPGLTPVQSTVGALAAQGLTNAEIGRRMFISTRTVEHHLTAIYANLGITSRRHLRRLVEGGAVWGEKADGAAGPPDGNGPSAGDWTAGAEAGTGRGPRVVRDETGRPAGRVPHGGDELTGLAGSGGPVPGARPRVVPMPARGGRADDPRGPLPVGSGRRGRVPPAAAAGAGAADESDLDERLRARAAAAAGGAAEDGLERSGPGGRP